MMTYKVGGYNKSKMQDLAKRDAFIRMMAKDMMKNGDEENALNVLYNSEVLDGNLEMQKSYDQGMTK